MIKFGDIVEIPIGDRFAYAQYTHRNGQYGALIRVLTGVFDKRPDDFSQIATGPTKFWTFFPLQAAVNRKIVVVVAREPIPPFAQQFPVFRSGLPNPTTRKVDVWWLWDGEKEWRVGQLTNEERRLPICGIVNDTLLIERIASDWTPEKDPT